MLVFSALRIWHPLADGDFVRVYYHVVIGKYVALLRIDDDVRARALPGITPWSQIGIRRHADRQAAFRNLTITNDCTHNHAQDESVAYALAGM